MSGGTDSTKKAIRSMEADVFNVQRWGDLIAYIGRMSEAPEPECLAVVGIAISDLGKKIEDGWRKALHATQP